MKYFSLIILFTFFALRVGGQALNSEADVKKHADELFDKKEYVEATQYYLRLLSLNPRKHEYHYKYGTCLLFNAIDKSKAIGYLEYAVQSAVIPAQAYYYLGKAYHLNYQFKKATAAYENFKSKADKKVLSEHPVDRDIEACNNGKKLLMNINDLIVMSKQQVPASSFFRSYRLDNIGGTILVTEEFATKEDKKRGYTPVVHFNANNNTIAYASYGDDGDNLDIYIRKRLPDGDWASPQKIKGQVNTKYDENYPFIHPSGRYLYFSSKGHNSMGGYDVFRSQYDPTNDTYGDPENVDFAISSPDDDLFYILDSINQNAYFASARESEDGKIHVYNVRVERIPIQIAVIKGSFLSEITPANKKCQIKVLDFNTEKEIGVFNSKPENGDYLIVFPKSGKYRFLVEAAESEYTHTSVVEIPYVGELRPLKQAMKLVMEGGEERLIITNKFDERFENEAEILAEILKGKSQLEPNAEQFNIDSLSKAAKSNAALLEAGLDENITPENLIEILNNEKGKTEREILEMEARSNKVLQTANDYFLQAEILSQETEALIKKAENTDDAEEKEKLLTQAGITNHAALVQNQKGKEALELAEIDRNEIENKKNVLNQIDKMTDELSEMDSEDKNSLITLVDENMSVVQTSAKPNLNRKTQLELKREEGRSKADEAYELKKQQDVYRTDLNNLKTDINNLNKQLETTTKKKEIASIEEEIKRKEQTLAVVEDEINVLDKKIAALEGAWKSSYDEILSTSNKKGTSLSDEEARTIIDKASSSDQLNSKLNENKTTLKNMGWSEEIPTDDKIKEVLTQSEQQVQNSKWVDILEEDIAKQEKLLAETNDPAEKEKIQQKINELKEQKEEKEKQLATNTTNQEKTNNDTQDKQETNEKENIPANSDYPEVKQIKSFTEDYYAEIDRVKQNTSDSEEQEKEVYKMNLSKKTELEQLIQQLEKLKTEDPDAATEIENAISSIRQVQTEINNDIAAYEAGQKELEQSSNKFDDQAEELMKGFSERKSALADDETKSELDKANETIALHNDLIDNVDKELTKVEKKLNKDPENEELLKEKENLEQIRMIAEAVVDEQNQIKAGIASSQNNGQKDTVSASTDDFNTLTQNYNDERQEIESNNELSIAEKEEKIATLNKTFIAAMENKIAQGELDSEEEKQAENLIAQKKEENKNITPESASFDKNLAISLANPNHFNDKAQLEDAEDSPEKWEKLGELNEVLIQSLQEKKENSDDENYKREITKLIEELEAENKTYKRQLKEARQKDADELDLIVAELTNPDSGETSTGNEKIMKSATIIEDYNNEIEQLEEEKENASEKEIEKIDKKINKLESKKAKEENELAVEISEKNQQEIKSLQENKDKKTVLVKSAIVKNDTLAQSINDKKALAEEKLNEAEEKKANAEKEKDPIKKNKLLREAIVAEQQAKTALEQAEGETKILEKEAEFNKKASDDLPVISSVPENETERVSYTYETKAQELNLEANAREARGQELRDSAKTVKKKYREAVLLEAEKEEDLAVKYRSAGADMQTKANELKEKENQILAIKTEIPDKQLSSSEKEEIKATETYKAFYEDQKEANEKLEEADKLAAEIEEKETKKQKKVRAASVLYVEAENAKNPEEAEQKKAMADEIWKEAEEIQNDINNLKSEEKELRAEGLQQTARNIEYVKQNDPENSSSILAMTKNLESPVTRKTEPSAMDPLAKGFVPPTELNGSIFELSKNSVYSDSNPIPVNAQDPKGLVFKVQIGAFSKPVPQDAFKKFAPLSGQKLDNGITRYMAGYFNNLGSADEAKDQIRSKGYPDAFVVAYYNNERISIERARKIQQDQGIDNQILAENKITQENSQTEENTQNRNTEEKNTDKQPVSENTQTTNETNKTTDYYNDKDAAPADQVEGISGLFFTVQVGVYSKPVPSSQIFNISPLNTEKINNSLIRYTTGVYSSAADATKRKDEIVNLGVTDAFVTAYYNGKRTTVAEANSLLEKEGSSILAKNIQQEKQPDTKNEEQEQENKNETEVVEEKAYYKDGVYYRLKFGQFYDRLPSDFAFLLLSGEYYISEETQEDGSTIYFSDRFKKFEEVSNLKNRVDQEYQGTEIIAFHRYEEISLEKAEDILSGRESTTTDKESLGTDDDGEEFIKEGVYFKVFLGKFEQEIPSSLALFLMGGAGIPIEAEMDIEGFNKFYTYRIDTYEEALNVEEEIKSQGIEGTAVIAFYKYDIITLEKAFEILSQ